VSAGPAFRDVARSQDPEALVAYLVAVSERPEIREHARWRAERAGIAPGARVLDLGCGVGSNTALLADRVGPQGRVVGLDKSAEMVAAASQRVQAGNAAFETGDARALPFEAGAFDAVWLERTLVHIEETDRALSECKRVLAAGGTIVIAELDYTGVLIDDPHTPELTRRILRQTVDPAAQPRIGRQLLRRLVEADLAPSDLHDHLHRIGDFATLAGLLTLETGCRRAIDSGRATEPGCRAWWRSLAELSDSGKFTSLIPVITAIAEKAGTTA